MESVTCPSHRWVPLASGWLKLNVDASVRSDSDTISIAIILRDHLGMFVTGKAVCLVEVGGVFEAEVTAISEGLKWLQFIVGC